MNTASENEARSSEMSEIASQIIDLFKRSGGSQYGGEAVTQLEHGLQAAWLAEQEGSSADLIVAALLHDVGHLLHDLPDDSPDHGIDDAHEVRGADWLRGRFPDSVLMPVLMHVDAKRYLCSIEPGYWESLSGPSQTSLILQGGKMDDAECAAFRDNDFFEPALRLRRWDDLSKIEGLRTPPLEHFVAYVDEVLTADSIA